MKKLKEKGTGGIISHIIYILMGGAIGLNAGFILDNAGLLSGGLSLKWKVLLFVLLIVYFYVSSVIQVIVHESGHLIFGLLSGYKFLSFRIFSTIWVKNEGEIIRKKYTIPGTAGQCLMWPPDYNDGNFPYVMYNLGGGFMNIIISTLLLSVAGLVRSKAFLWLFIIFVAYYGYAMAIINLLPMRVGGISNDGKNIMDMRKDDMIKKAFWRELYINAQISTGKRYSELDESLFDISGINVKNPIGAYIYAVKANRHLECCEYEDAYEIYEHMLSGESTGVFVSEISAGIERAFLMMMLGMDSVEIEKRITPGMKKYMKSAKILPQTKRFEYAYELYVNKNMANAEKAEEEFNKNITNSPNIGDNMLEKQLFLLFKEKYFAKYSESDYNVS